MTQLQLDCAVAHSTGESLRTIRHLGFGLHVRTDADLEPEDLRLVLDCPFCGRPVAYPGRGPDVSPALAECDHCDVEFDFSESEVYAAGPADPEDGADLA